jgi:hypothetical protein
MAFRLPAFPNNPVLFSICLSLDMKHHIALLSATLALGTASLVSLPAQANPGESIYLAQSPMGATYTTVRSDGGIDIQITSGNQRIYTTLRPGENSYVGQDGIMMVNFIPSTGQVTVYSAETGETFYDYYTQPVTLGGGSGSSDQSANPTTYMTRQGPNEIIVQITDGGFYFRDTMHRGYGNTYQAVDHGYRVNYDGDSGRITVISDATGAEFYNYFYTGTVGGASGSSGGSYGRVPSEAYLTRVSDDEYNAELSEGQFYFSGPLYRSSGDTFVGSNGRFRVMYDRTNGRVVVINLTTGEELFNYGYSEVDEGYL